MARKIIVNDFNNDGSDDVVLCSMDQTLQRRSHATMKYSGVRLMDTTSQGVARPQSLSMVALLMMSTVMVTWTLL